MRNVGKTSVFEMPDGRFRAVVTVKDALGRPKPVKREGKTAAIARKKAEDAAREAIRLQPSTDMTVAAMCDAFMARCKRLNRAPATLRDYEGIKTQIVEPKIGHLKIRDLQVAHVEEMIKGLPDKRAINARAFLRVAINKVARKASPELPNVAQIAEPPSYSESAHVTLRPENLEATIAAEPDAVKRAFFLLLADTGLRPVEARCLTWFELHKRPDGLWIELHASKTEEGKKPVPVSPSVADLISELPRRSSFIFPRSRIDDEPYADTTWMAWWRDAQVRAGVPVTTLYQLRHLFGTRMAAKVKRSVLKRLARHKDARTTERYYVDHFSETLRAAKEQ